MQNPKPKEPVDRISYFKYKDICLYTKDIIFLEMTMATALNIQAYIKR